MASYRIRDWIQHFENNRTRELKRMDWVPIPNRMDGSGYTELLDHPNGAAHLGAWLAIVEIASRRHPRGTLPQDGAEIPQALARISRIPVSVFVEVIPRLLKINWIEQVTEIPQDGAALGPQEGASSRARSYGTEGNGREWNGSKIPPAPLAPKNREEFDFEAWFEAVYGQWKKLGVKRIACQYLTAAVGEGASPETITAGLEAWCEHWGAAGWNFCNQTLEAWVQCEGWKIAPGESRSNGAKSTTREAMKILAQRQEQARKEGRR